MKRMLLVVLLASLTFSCSNQQGGVSAPANNEFDVYCQAFSDLTDLPGYNSLSSEDRNQALLKLIEPQVATTSDAYIAWDAIQFAESGERYQLFTEAAEATLKRKWECPAMRSHAHEVGSS